MIDYNNMKVFNIVLNDEMLNLLIRGGVVNHQFNDIKVIVRQEKKLVTIDLDDFIDLKRHVNDPGILTHILRKIDK